MHEISSHGWQGITFNSINTLSFYALALRFHPAMNHPLPCITFPWILIVPLSGHAQGHMSRPYYIWHYGWQRDRDYNPTIKTTDTNVTFRQCDLECILHNGIMFDLISETGLQSISDGWYIQILCTWKYNFGYWCDLGHILGLLYGG